MKKNNKKKFYEIIEQYIQLEQLIGGESAKKTLEEYKRYLNKIKKQKELSPTDIKKAYIIYFEILEAYVNWLEKHRKEIIQIFNQINHIIIKINNVLEIEQPNIFEDITSTLDNHKKKIRYLRVKNKTNEEVSEECNKILFKLFEQISNLRQLDDIKNEISKLQELIDSFMKELNKEEEDDV